MTDHNDTLKLVFSSSTAILSELEQVAWPLSVKQYKHLFPGRALTKDAFIIGVLNTEPEACREGADKDVEVKEEGHPGGGLVLRYWCNNGNVDLSIAVYNTEHKEKGETTENSMVRWKCIIRLAKRLALKCSPWEYSSCTQWDENQVSLMSLKLGQTKT